MLWLFCEDSTLKKKWKKKWWKREKGDTYILKTEYIQRKAAL